MAVFLLVGKGAAMGPHAAARHALSTCCLLPRLGPALRRIGTAPVSSRSSVVSGCAGWSCTSSGSSCSSGSRRRSSNQSSGDDGSGSSTDKSVNIKWVEGFGSGAPQTARPTFPETGDAEGRAPQRSRAGVLHSGPDPSATQVIESLSVEDVESFPRFQKPFVDRLWVEVKAGNGGNPAKNAIRSPGWNGPGFGGHGGSIFLKATHLIESFLDVPEKIKSAHGGDGHDTHRGKHADDLCVQVPLGTIVRERVYSGERTEENRRIFVPQFRYQLLRSDDTYVIAKGGVGGVGPRSFKKGDGRKGTPGERARLELELRIVNDCAFVGLPNAGKTSLLAALSRAHTRIGPEEFSTTRPHVGVIRFSDSVHIRLCDLPGLKQGAHADKDIGRRILRHTYRSRVLVFVVDVARGGGDTVHDALAEVEMLREEACMYDPLNREKPWMVVGTKCDAFHRDALFHLDSLYVRLRARHGREVPVVGTSSRFGLGLTRLVRTMRNLLYPDAVDNVLRVPAMPVVDTRLPGVLHDRFDGALPSLGPSGAVRTRQLLMSSAPRANSAE